MISRIRVKRNKQVQTKKNPELSSRPSQKDGSLLLPDMGAPSVIRYAASS